MTAFRLKWLAKWPATSLASLLLLAVGCGRAESGMRGVLLISVDSLRADHLSCYGYESKTRPGVPTTPIVDRMVAQRGLRFESAYTTTSWTLPAHMALFTGMPDELHGVRAIPKQLHPSRPWLAEAMRDAGWRTAGFWSGPNLHPFFGFDRGFDVYRDCSATAVEDASIFTEAPTTYEGVLEDQEAFQRLVDMHETSHEGVTGPRVVAEFAEWFSEIDEGERFFAFIHLWDVHYDYEAPGEYDVFFPGYRGPIDGRGFTDLDVEELKHNRNRTGLDRLISLYDAEIRFTDANVGKLLDEIDRRGRLDDTLVVFLADHGEEFLEHRALGHKHSLYEESVRVPLLMRLPGVVPERAVSTELASITDVAPTILDLAGVDVPDGMWGTSLVRVFGGGSMPERVLPFLLDFQPAPQVWRASHDGRFKVNDIPGRPTEKKIMNNHAVFDLEADPGEKTPAWVAKDAPSETTKKALRVWYEMDREAEQLPAPLDGELSDAEGLEDELVKAGYLGDDAVEDEDDEESEPR